MKATPLTSAKLPPARASHRNQADKAARRSQDADASIEPSGETASPASVRDDPQRPRRLLPACRPDGYLRGRLQRWPSGRPAGRRPHSLRQNESEEPASASRSQATIGWRKVSKLPEMTLFPSADKWPAVETGPPWPKAEPRQLRHPATAPQRLRRDYRRKFIAYPSLSCRHAKRDRALNPTRR